MPGLPIGVLAGVLALKGRGKLSGAILVGFMLLPALFTAKSLLGTFLLGIAGVLALLAKTQSSSRMPVA